MTLTLPIAKYLFPIALSLTVLGMPAVSHGDATAPAATTSTDQKIVLQYTRSSDMMYLMHWDKGKKTLPEGVDTIQSLPQANALLVHGTQAGRASVVDMIANMDVKPRYVQLHSKLVAVSADTFKKLGPNANKLLDTNTHVPADASMSFDQFALNNVTSTASFQSPLRCLISNLSDVEPIPTIIAATFSVAARINSDNTVTLLLSPCLTIADPQSSPPIKATETASSTTQYRSVKNGATIMIALPFSNGQSQPQTELLYFLTPTIVPDKPS